MRLPLSTAGGADTRRYGQSASFVLRAVLASETGNSMTLGELIAALHERAFGLLFILLALGNLVPGPPGIGGIFGIPMFVFAIQMALGGDAPRVPRVLARISFSKSKALAALERIAPLLIRIENLFRPRVEVLARGIAERLVAILIAVEALAMTLPIPFTNWPPAVAVFVLAMGIAERDGLAIVGGVFLSAIALAVVALGVSVYFTSIVLIFERVF